MKFEWDSKKNKTNKQKHGLSFEIACHVFDDPYSLIKQDEGNYGEEHLKNCIIGVQPR